jgi:hypothetical protein
MQTPTHSNLTDRSMTAPPPVLSASSILSPPSSSVLCFHFHKENFSASFKNGIFYFYFLKLEKSKIA